MSQVVVVHYIIDEKYGTYYDRDNPSAGMKGTPCADINAYAYGKHFPGEYPVWDINTGLVSQE